MQILISWKRTWWCWFTIIHLNLANVLSVCSEKAHAQFCVLCFIWSCLYISIPASIQYNYYSIVKFVQVNDTVHLVCKTHVKYSSVSSKEYYFITNITKECHTSVYILAEPLMASRILHVVIRKLCSGN